ncbi:MAG: 7-cyano-7-deazaguanine synthase QueC [Deltaproteobacteria bacterium]|nr:7-cyano-7-deazaguanine synthase QueC [Deltaproteobacteria bacterium]MBI3294364.1 7-cyano-7-deazaguanine synthase QueC [Deltaproteobacteria bacterium]
MRAILLLSGGLDSSANLVLAPQSGFTVTQCLTLDYGQRSRMKELAAAASLAHHFSVPNRVVALPFLAELQSGLTGREALPHPRRDELDDRAFALESADRVWVPNRNGVFLEVASALAESSGCGAVVVGFNKEEAATFPDNSQDYLQAINSALRFSTRGKVAVVSPTAMLDKTEIVARLKPTTFPWDKLWSCYESGDLMCGRCESCQRLKRALDANEVKRDSLFLDQTY